MGLCPSFPHDNYISQASGYDPLISKKFINHQVIWKVNILKGVDSSRFGF